MTSAGNLPQATVHGLFHLAIKTSDLAATRHFWTKVIGLRDMHRPDFGYPGAWLACPQPGGLAIIHVYAGGPALGADGKAPYGTGGYRSRLALLLRFPLLHFALQGGRSRLAGIRRARHDTVAALRL